MASLEAANRVSALQSTQVAMRGGPWFGDAYDTTGKLLGQLEAHEVGANVLQIRFQLLAPNVQGPWFLTAAGAGPYYDIHRRIAPNASLEVRLNTLSRSADVTLHVKNDNDEKHYRFRIWI